MAAGVSTTGDDFAVAVFLDEPAIAEVITVGALKAFTFLIFLYGRSVTLAILESALELGAIGIAGNALALDLAVQELPLEHIAALGGQLSLTIGSISFPQANVLVTILSSKKADVVRALVGIRADLQRLWHHFELDGWAKVPCHNDTYAVNWIVGEDALCMIDWEYAGMNDRVNDIATLVVRDGLDDEVASHVFASPITSPRASSSFQLIW